MLPGQIDYVNPRIEPILLNPRIDFDRKTAMSILVAVVTTAIRMLVPIGFPCRRLLNGNCHQHGKNDATYCWFTWKELWVLYIFV